MHLYPLDGAAQRVARDATPWSARDASWSMVVIGISPDPADAAALRAWGRTYWNAIHPYNQPGAYVNFMDADEAADRVELSYGNNYRRLATIKAKYDPGNLFRVNQNIKPNA
jgi:FAD/FMN-containing dehydrogenase